jgi:hypothetical protein
MKNLSISVDETLIQRARLVARARGTTLEAAFHEWLEQYAAQSVGTPVGATMRRIRRVRSAGPYTREQMNER